MSGVIYAIVFSGGIVDGFQPISVKAHLAKMLKADPEKMKVLFSGKQVVLKRTPDKEQAIKYGTALKKVGADVKIKAVKAPDKPTEQPKAVPAATAAAPVAVDTSSLSLAPNEGNIVEPSAPPPTPNLDLSEYALADNDDSPLAPPKPVQAVEIDLSEYSVRDNDGSPLVEAKADDAPKVDAPDFGLDEPGAVLETLKEEVELLNPDTSGMSLAAAGTDLIDEFEKPEAPPPKTPDTSSIHLVPNFDV